MAKYENSNDKRNYKIIEKEIKNFKNLIKGHENILEAIAKL